MTQNSGGSDKALIDLCDKPLIAHVVQRLELQMHCIIINANGDPARLAFAGHPVVPDTIPGNPGPLAGLLAGMEWVGANANAMHITHIMTVPTDTPFIPHDLAEHLSNAAGQGSAIAVSGEREHYAIGLWPVRLASVLQALLSNNGDRSARAFAERSEAARVKFEPSIINGRSVDPFFNINTPADLIDAKVILCP